MARPIRYPNRFSAALPSGNGQRSRLSAGRRQRIAGSALTALTALCMLVTVWPVSGKAATQANIPVHLWVAYGPQTRTPDGAVTQRFYIRSGGGSSDAARPQDGDVSDVRAFYRFGNRRGLQPTFHRARILHQDGDLYLDVSCPVMARVEVMVTATLSGCQGATRLTAQTTIFLFGKAADNPNPAAADPRTLPRPPLHLRPDSGLYWMQTGATYTFTYNGPYPATATVRVLENHRQIDSLVPAANGDFVYTPPHDPRLTLKIDNIFDEDYYEKKGFPKPGRAYYASYTFEF